MPASAPPAPTPGRSSARCNRTPRATPATAGDEVPRTGAPDRRLRSVSVPLRHRRSVDRAGASPGLVAEPGDERDRGAAFLGISLIVALGRPSRPAAPLCPQGLAGLDRTPTGSTPGAPRSSGRRDPGAARVRRTDSVLHPAPPRRSSSDRSAPVSPRHERPASTETTRATGSGLDIEPGNRLEREIQKKVVAGT